MRAGTPPPRRSTGPPRVPGQLSPWHPQYLLDVATICRESTVSRIGIILGSTRPNRNGEQVAHWVLEAASRRRDAYFELLDLRDYPLPHLDEPLPPSLGQYQNEPTRQWAAKIASFDGFVIVTPEYNHGTSGVLKNAIDYLYAEWNNKA